MALLWATAALGDKEHGDSPADYGFPVKVEYPNYLGDGGCTESKIVHLHPDEPLTATQDWVDRDHPAIKSYDPKKAARKPLPQIIALGGVNYINDGHHRIIGARLAGKKIKSELLYDPDEYQGEHPDPDEDK